ncbi:MAG: GNAT family N-acetyltransferase, partial [Lachnospiraceae bacterium]|nr:GNAT family N-acetyltransferase [Lachnospiraceae bacterium]
MIIRHATENDFARMMEIYEYARGFMADHGNPNQWGPTKWPPAELLHEDIRMGHSYVCEEDGRVVGTFYYNYGNDIEPTYAVIEDGKWLSDDIYGVVHRIAGDGSVKG